jgi:hypothetical protein
VSCIYFLSLPFLSFVQWYLISSFGYLQVFDSSFQSRRRSSTSVPAFALGLSSKELLEPTRMDKDLKEEAHGDKISNLKEDIASPQVIHTVYCRAQLPAPL